MLVTWKPIQINPTLAIHINTFDYWANNWEWTFTETAYTDWAWTYIWILDNATIPTTSFNFNIVEKTEVEINALLETWYGLDWNSNPYVSYSNWEFIDNRINEI